MRTVAETKDNYFLYLSRVIEAKGVHIAMQVAEAVNGQLIIAGPGSIDAFQTCTDRPISEYIQYGRSRWLALRQVVTAPA